MKHLIVFGFLFVSLVMPVYAQNVLSGRMNLKSYHDLVRKFKADSTYEKASFYPRKAISYRIDLGKSINHNSGQEQNDLIIASGTKGRLISYRESSEKGRLGTTVTYTIRIDFGDGVVIPFFSQSFYSSVKHVKNWTLKNFTPVENFELDDLTYLLKGEGEKLGLNYSYYVSPSGYANQ